MLNTFLILCGLLSPLFADSEKSSIDLNPADVKITSYFKSSYEDSRSDFLARNQKLISQNFAVDLKSYNIPAGTIDYAFYTAKNPQSDKLLILISGTHGIEGFVGSAVQSWILDEKIQDLTRDTNLLLIHGLNPFGMKQLRRVNENNMDLNRSFILNRSQKIADDEKYKLITEFLNPDRPVELSWLHQSMFYMNSFYYILKYGLETLRVSILQGQYSVPQGLFYGGTDNPPQQKFIDEIISQYAKNSKKVFIIDLHTGYGQRGKLHLLAGRKSDPSSAGLQNIFSNQSIDFADQKKFYPVQGDLLTYFQRKTELAGVPQVLGITFEYGTLDSQNTLGSIESLKRMIFENQNFWHPTSSKDTNLQINQLFIEMFNPQDLSWRKSILEQTNLAINNLKNNF